MLKICTPVLHFDTVFSTVRLYNVLKNSWFINAIRWVLIVPIMVILIFLVCTGIELLTEWLLGVNWNFLNIFLFIFIAGGSIFALPMMLSFAISFLVVSITPNRKVGGIIYLIVAAVNYIYLIYAIWTLPSSYPLMSIVILTLMTILIIVISFSSISGVFGGE